MTKTQEIMGKQWGDACAKVGAIAIKMAALREELAQLESTLDTAARQGMTLDASAHWASEIEKALTSVAEP